MRVIFALGFRPFFLLAGWLAILLMAFWVPVFVGGVPFDIYYAQIDWHSHEMIFGYTVAVIAGFLLTAVRNWTNTPTPSGLPLAGMGALWLIARILPILVAIFPRWLIAAADLAFLPTFAIGIAVPLLKNNEKQNLIFLPLLAVLWSADLLVHADVLGLAPNLARKGVFLGLDVIILVIVIMGGRVIPFFTERALSVVLKRWRIVEWLSPVSVVLFLLTELFVPDSVTSASLAALAACANGARLAGWYTPRYWRVPLLWVLHLGYGWIVVGFYLKAGTALGLVPPQFTIHAFTVGGIGVLTLGMMARVSLGHTGRPLKVGAAMTSAFVLINLAAVGRGLLPPFFPQFFSQLIVASGVFWIAAFTIFIIVYTPILIQPRVDGRPG
jgi:uncharacterized protein involved in response to NO